MGCGKTTIGKILSEALNEKWIDLDDYIEKKAGKRISEIFKEEGEAYFRALEQECLKQFLQEEKGIISTGGGVIISPENVKMLQKTCTIYLAYPFDILYSRIAGDANRPLATSYKELQERFYKRLDLYEQASQVKIDCKDKSINQITQEILTYLEKIS